MLNDHVVDLYTLSEFFIFYRVVIEILTMTVINQRSFSSMVGWEICFKRSRKEKREVDDFTEKKKPMLLDLDTCNNMYNLLQSTTNREKNKRKVFLL